MLCKLSLKNIKKSFKDYAIYFFTLILGISIFYVFNAIDSQTVMMDVTKSTREIIKLMTNMLSGVSVFVSFILGFLIIYASRFLIKRRNKEFGIYLTLGMSKRKISMILFFETLFIGIISLVVGLCLGVLLSQFMSMLVASLFEADLTSFEFTFSQEAFIKTLVYFGIMYLLVMVFNTINISRCKLIDLLQASKKSEKIKLKNPYLCAFLFIVSSCCLGYAYSLVLGGLENFSEAQDILVPIAIGAISTFLIIFSLSGLILRIVMKVKALYFHGLNSFVLRQISSKINTTVVSMTIICLMLFVTICILSSSLSIKNSMTKNLVELAPADIEFDKKYDLTSDLVQDSWNLTEDMIDDSKVSNIDTLKMLDIDINKYLKDLVDINLYASEDFLMYDSLGDYYEEISKTYPLLTYDAKEEVVKVSDYNKIADIYGLEKISLNEGEYVIVADFKDFVDIRNEPLKRNTPVTILNKVYYPKYQECVKGFVHMSNNYINTGLFVVPDDAVDESIRYQNILVGNYKDEFDKQVIEEMFLDLENHSNIKKTNLQMSTKIHLYEASVGLGAMVTFIGLYLGIIFLMSSAAILALKELSESSDNKMRFRMLRKLGTDEKEINKALFYQIAIFFLFPLILALIHSIVGIQFCNDILATFGSDELLTSIIMTAGFIVIIYGGYFLLTYICSKRIIKER